jgi:hypothetical protein
MPTLAIKIVAANTTIPCSTAEIEGRTCARSFAKIASKIIPPVRGIGWHRGVSLSVHRQRQPAALSSVCPSGVAIRVTTVRRHDELCAIRANVMRRINRASAFGGGEYPERLDILAPIWVESLGVAHFNKCQKRPASAATCSRNHDIRPGEGDRPARPRWRREQPTDPRTSRRLGALKSPSAGSALVTAYYRRLQPSNRSAWAWAWQLCTRASRLAP